MVRKYASLAALTLVVVCVDGGRSRAAPPPLSRAERQVVAGSNALGFGLLRELARGNPTANVVVSPLSASMALGMTMTGATGAARQGMGQVLGLEGMSAGQAGAGYRGLIALLRGHDPKMDLRLANSIWTAQRYPVRPGYAAAAHRDFAATVRSLDFADPGAAATINRWVRNGTDGKIAGIIKPPIPPTTAMYLLDAVYFHGRWLEPFDPGETTTSPFTRADGSRIDVAMMHESDVVAYFETPEARGIELPYGHSGYVMTVILPVRGTLLHRLIASLDSATWRRWLAAESSTYLALSLPRFRLQSTRSLKRALTALGMRAAFRPGRADFSGVSPSGRQLFISHVLQTTYVNVDEQGTKAAAATSVEQGATSAPPPRVRFIVDRPFLVAIRERSSGTILFLAAIGAPGRA